MEENVKLIIDGQEYEYPKETRLAELACKYQEKEKDDIILAMLDGKLRELHKSLGKGGQLKFITTRDKIGRKTYRRSLTFLLQKAVANLLDKKDVKLRVLHSIGQGIYCELSKEGFLNETFLKEIKEEMHRLVKLDLPFQKSSIHKDDAIAIFKELGMEEKVRLFRYRRNSRVNIYELDGYADYFYGYMAKSTGILKYFDIIPYQNGFVLMFPDKSTKEVAEFQPLDKFYQTLKEANEWAKTMEIQTIGALNDAIVNGKIAEVILIQEALMEQKIGQLAERIAGEKDKKFIMIAGPSSSGKTTFSHRLSIQLRAHGLKPHPIPLDDFYKNREDVPKDEHGEYDLECLDALDVERFNHDMQGLLQGEEVELPIFNFKTGKRADEGRRLKLGNDDVLVIEGIHGLNDRLSNSLPKESKFKIYISALTQIDIDEYNLLPTTDARLLRRIVRDARTRGSDAKETISMWDSVRRGEEKYIFPFQENADVMFNSALIYEMAVLKNYAEPLLFAIKEQDSEYVEAKRLLKFLDYFLTIPSENIPKNSIIREFIGNSVFFV